MKQRVAINIPVYCSMLASHPPPSKIWRAKVKSWKPALVCITNNFIVSTNWNLYQLETRPKGEVPTTRHYIHCLLPTYVVTREMGFIQQQGDWIWHCAWTCPAICTYITVGMHSPITHVCMPYGYICMSVMNLAASDQCILYISCWLHRASWLIHPAHVHV